MSRRAHRCTSPVVECIHAVYHFDASWHPLAPACVAGDAACVLHWELLAQVAAGGPTKVPCGTSSPVMQRMR